jgi:hypothetical protein
VQRDLAKQLEASDTRWIIRTPGGYWREPNESVKEGSGFLDEYIHSHYRAYQQFGWITLLKRNDVE